VHKFLRILLWGISGFIALVIPFYAEEDWRGARAWAACQRDLAAKGESLDLRQLVPSGKPEDDLSQSPIFAELYKNESQYVHPHQLKVYVFDLWKHERPPARVNQITAYLNADPYAKKPEFPHYVGGNHLDLAAWQKFYRSLPQSPLTQTNSTPAQDVLQALGQFDSDLTKIDTAVSNQAAYWPIDYEKPFISNLDGNSCLDGPTDVVVLKGVAHLDNHEVDRAERDYLFSFRLSQPLLKGCFLINYGMISYIRSSADLILWEGLHRHAWDDAQLHEMESALAASDMLALAKQTLRIERACTIASIDFIKNGGGDQLRAAGGVAEFDKYGYYDAVRQLNYRPSGEWDQDKTFYAKSMQERIEAIHLDRGTMDPGVFNYEKDSAMWYGRQRLTLYMSTMQLRVIDGFGQTIAVTETYRRLARLSCRLEEYRLEHGQYPDQLDALPDLPAHLNQEVLSEQPFRYQHKGDGYLLYSVGWKQKDNGGIYSAKDRESDWPWPSP